MKSRRVPCFRSYLASKTLGRAASPVSELGEGPACLGGREIGVAKHGLGDGAANREEIALERTVVYFGLKISVALSTR